MFESISVTQTKKRKKKKMERRREKEEEKDEIRSNFKAMNSKFQNSLEEKNPSKRIQTLATKVPKYKNYYKINLLFFQILLKQNKLDIENQKIKLVITTVMSYMLYSSEYWTSKIRCIHKMCL